MKRVFSVLRRKAGFVDLSIPLVAGVTQYRLKAAQNWDGATSNILLVEPTGYFDPDLMTTVVPTVDHNPNAMRVLFKPSKYTAGTALSDTGPFWLQLAYLINGVEQNAASATPPSAITMIGSAVLPHNAMQAITGTAPNQGTLANATQIDLPRSVENVSIENQGSADLFVAFDSAGPEVPIKAGKTMGTVSGGVSSLYVRGSGSTVPFTMTFTYAIPK